MFIVCVLLFVYFVDYACVLLSDTTLQNIALYLCLCLCCVIYLIYSVIIFYIVINILIVNRNKNFICCLVFLSSVLNTLIHLAIFNRKQN